MKRYAVLLLVLSAVAAAAERRAKNVILFLGDGTGPSTINAASIYGYSKPRSLFIQNMPYIALSETSSASSWVTDSAAGMTAIVTGQKTHNGVISQSASAVRGAKDGEPLKTILEFAEENGLSSGVVSNSQMADATPAACYAHANDRRKFGEIFAQVLNPRFGDGVDVIIGPGHSLILAATRQLGIDLETALPKKGFAVAGSLDKIPAGARRAVVLFETAADFDLGAATRAAIDILSRNPKGFFLMVESNNHSKNVIQTLERTVTFDRIIRQTAQQMKKDTLVLFTADHSYDLRLPRAQKGQNIVETVKVDGSHTAEEVLVTADGPGAEKVRGIISNTDLFDIMREAYGWKASQ